MVRLSYCSLNLAETEVCTAVPFYIQRRLNRVFSGTSFYRSVYTWSVLPHSLMTLRFAMQDVNRVLKPGGVLEVCHLWVASIHCDSIVTCQVIEEDLIFPGNKLPPSEFNLNVPPGQNHRPQSGLVPPLSARSDSHFPRSPDSRTIDVQNTPPSSPFSYVDSRSQQGRNHSEADLSSQQYTIDPFDHSRLTRAWHEMLTSRWISSRITSVLPFYMSAIFQNFRALPALEIFIGPSPTLYPPSSEGHQQMINPEPFRHLTHATVKDDAASSTTWIPKREAPPPHLMPSHAPMHLARMVAIVLSCKDAIWGAYNKLYANDRRLPRLNDEPGKTSVHTIREEFENHWLNWEWYGSPRSATN
jgi:hypothetical protein